MSVTTSIHNGFPLPGGTTNDKRLVDIAAVKMALVAIDAIVKPIDLQSVVGDILPADINQNIGSATKRFKAIYVDEAHLSINTLYLGDTAVMGTTADVVNIKADPGQSINIKTTGVGNTMITSEHGVSLSTTGADADVVVQATGIGAQVRFSAQSSVVFTAPEMTLNGNATVSGNKTVGGSLTVTGDLIVNGSNTVVNSTTVSTKDNIIMVNKGQVGSGVSAGLAGLTIDRGDAPAYQMVFDETSDMFKVGEVGNLQTIASQNFVTAGDAAVLAAAATDATAKADAIGSNFTPVAHVGSGGNAHANAVAGGAAGFITGADQAKLDGLSSGGGAMTAATPSVIGAIFGKVLNDGQFNTSVGYTAYSVATTGISNTAIGFAAMQYVTTGSWNVAVGRNALKETTGGINNTAVGYQSLQQNVYGGGNTAVGTGSLSNNTSSDNTGLGNLALAINTAGMQNVAVGASSLYRNTTGSYNVAVGNSALFYNTIGIKNTAIGSYALNNNIAGINNTALGFATMQYNTTGSSNTAVGYYALGSNTVGTNNVALGYTALSNNIHGAQNTAVGGGALTLNNSGTGNTAVGLSALSNNRIGSQNTAIGAIANPYGTADQNTVVGYNAGSILSTGANNLVLGFSSQALAATSSNSVTLGNTAITSLRCNTTAITSLSDVRDKTSIEDIGLGLDFLATLRPVKYQWDRREWYDDGVSDGTKKTEALDYGFIAQELLAAQEAANVPGLNLVLTENPERFEATPGRLLPIMVQALIEANARIKALEAAVQALTA